MKVTLGKREISALSILISIIFFIISLFIFGISLSKLIILITISSVIAILPSFFYTYLTSKKIRGMEERFPDFLRDILSGVKAGMTLPKAIMHCANIDYGPLTPEVRKMATQLSWDVPFPKVIKSFAEGVKDSPFLLRGATVLLECSRSGGDIAAVIESTIENMTIIKRIESERSSIISQQVLTLIIIQFVFIVILVMVYKLFLPLLSSFYSLKGAQTALLPIAVINPAEAVDHFKTLFLITLIVSALVNGIIIGKTKEGKALMGMKYSIFLLIVSLIAYALFIMPRSVEVKCELPTGIISSGQEVEITCQLLVDVSPIKGVLLNLSLEHPEWSKTITVVTDSEGKFKGKFKIPTIRGNLTIGVSGSYTTGLGESIQIDERIGVEVA
ncbi:MAG: type II secretion system F family protein [Candidatus Nanoarchaeia archaeon]|nr:type II secretion system F family protein [Candidatus Haiyanarchaeum thermophilum]MCW1303155.1 type II secretion system F family protein [Candidatus Haiyanarchaeum thermophilum]MCW1303820.1 type II secretion system F family protein [Candidatus Haiyanarchaeum thermophilum]MCW1306563.1 type II secretion system F family protein [Candidatus Haiyanarchaeum thermophilum]MCW1306977.1 type II secretion system F family protein [Candidatus Haiyanarchaeum thermophilum]